MYNSIANDVNKLSRLELTEPRIKKLPTFKQLQEIFMRSKVDDKADDEVDDKVDDETDNDMDYKTDE